MRFAHLSDLHLGKRVCEFSMLEDQKYILEQILALLDAHPVDGVLLAGDLYDKPVPPAEAVRLLDWFLTQLAARGLPVFAISGNHDSADRVAFGSALLETSRVYVSPVFSGAPQPLCLADEHGPVDVYLLPFLKPASVRHVWPDEPIDCGTPLKYSFSEAHQHKSITFVDLGEKGCVDISTAPLTPLHDLREVRGSYLELTDHRTYEGTATDDYLHITLTDEQDVPDALAKLRLIYPNLMRLDYDNLRTREDQQITAPERVENITPLQHLAAFYELQNNQPLTDEQAAFCQQLIEDIWKEGEDA